MVTLQAQELQSFDPPIGKPEGMSADEEVTLYGGASLIFDEYGRLKYQVLNRINNSSRQTPRLKYLWKYGYFATKDTEENLFARLHLSRALNLTTNVSERF
jgi:hypothetical protein